MAERRLIAATPDRRARKLPVPAYDGQDFGPLMRGMDQYSPDPAAKFYSGYDVDLFLYRLENAKLLVKTGVDGVVMTSDGRTLEEPSCFFQPEFLQRAIDDDADLTPTGSLGSAFLAFDAAWHNYYHWICYGLAKAKLAEPYLPEQTVHLFPKYEQRPEGLHLAYSESVFRDSIALFNLQKPQLELEVGIYHIDELYFIATEPRLPPDILISRPFRDLFQDLRKGLPPAPGAPKNIFASRAKAGSRRMEDDLEQRLFDVASKHGFERVVFEEMSFLEQISTLNAAETFISPHGAGFTNLLFAPSDLGVIELNQDIDGQGYFRACFYLLAEMSGQTYGFLDAASANLDGLLDEAIRRLFEAKRLRA